MGLLAFALLAAAVAGVVLYNKYGKILPYMEQLTKEQIGESVDLQHTTQKDAHYVGSNNCKKCHEDQFAD